jgi:hypothetical protein
VATFGPSSGAEKVSGRVNPRLLVMLRVGVGVTDNDLEGEFMCNTCDCDTGNIALAKPKVGEYSFHCKCGFSINLPVDTEACPCCDRKISIRMERASPVEMRKCLELVEQLKKAGIAFMPIPIINDHEALYEMLNKKLEVLERVCTEG